MAVVDDFHLLRGECRLEQCAHPLDALGIAGTLTAGRSWQRAPERPDLDAVVDAGGDVGIVRRPGPRLGQRWKFGDHDAAAETGRAGSSASMAGHGPASSSLPASRSSCRRATCCGRAARRCARTSAPSYPSIAYHMPGPACESARLYRRTRTRPVAGHLPAQPVPLRDCSGRIAAARLHQARRPDPPARRSAARHRPARPFEMPLPTSAAACGARRAWCRGATYATSRYVMHARPSAAPTARAPAIPRGPRGHRSHDH